MAFWRDFLMGVAQAFVGFPAPSGRPLTPIIPRREGETDRQYETRCGFIHRMRAAEADREALRSDWCAVGADIWLALEKRKNELP